jgi:hypothetical protein
MARTLYILLLVQFALSTQRVDLTFVSVVACRLLA